MRAKTIEDIYKMAEEKGIPYFAYFEPTFNCNLKCLHCFTNYQHPGKELSFEEITGLLRQLAKAGTLFITFSGGEPFMRKDFIGILEVARKLDFAITIITNATLVTDELAEKISHLYPRLIKITLYGGTEKMFRKTTGKPGLFHRAINGIRLLAKHKLPVLVSSPIFNFYTVKDVLAIKKICSELGVAFKTFTNFQIRHNGDPAPLKYNLSESQFKTFARRFPGLSLYVNNGGKVRNNEKVCEGTFLIHINPYGQVGFCDWMVSKSSIREKSPLEIWENDVFLKKVRKITWKNMSNCLMCKSSNYCQPCLGVNLLSTGCLTKAPLFYCKNFHILRRVSENLCSKFEKSTSAVMDYAKTLV